MRDSLSGCKTIAANNWHLAAEPGVNVIEACHKPAAYRGKML